MHINVVPAAFNVIKTYDFDWNSTELKPQVSVDMERNSTGLFEHGAAQPDVSLQFVGSTAATTLYQDVEELFR